MFWQMPHMVSLAKRFFSPMTGKIWKNIKRLPQHFAK